MTFEPVGPVIIYKASDRHKAGRRRLSGYPFFVGQRGLFEPVQRYLRHRKVSRGRQNGTLMNDALILRRWVSYLDQKKLNWTQASDHLFERFVNERAGEVSPSRLQTEINVIWSFYWVAQEKLGLISGVVENPERGEIGRLLPISAVLTHKRSKDGRLIRRLGPQISLNTTPQGSLRPTPNDEQVEQILSALLSASSRGRGAAWWLMANWMYRSTLRCVGVARLTVGALSEALSAEGIRAPVGPYGLAQISEDPEQQERIKSELSALARRGRTQLFVRVVEKRSKARFVPISIDDFELNLDFIWSDRSWLVKMFRGRSGFNGTDALFPSMKTGGHYLPGSISNLINSQFRRLDVPGSAHRLRAACCVRIMRDCYIRARALHGRSWDPNAVLLEVAEVMGHSNPETLRPYLTRVQKEEDLLPGEPLVVPAGTSALLGGLADALASDTGELRAGLQKFLKEKGVGEHHLGRSLDDVRSAFRVRASVPGKS